MKPAVQCVGGAGKKKPTVEQVGLLEQRNCFPCGNASTDPGCNYQCRCVCEVGVGMQMKLNVLRSMSAGWPQHSCLHLSVEGCTGKAAQPVKAHSLVCEGSRSTGFATISVHYCWVYWQTERVHV